MATIRKMGKKWQAVIRIKKRQLSKSFEKKSDAVKWSAKVEYEIEQGVFNNSDRLNSLKVSELLWLYYEKTKHQTKWSERLKYEILNLCKFPITKLFMGELTTLRVAETLKLIPLILNGIVNIQKERISYIVPIILASSLCKKKLKNLLLPITTA